MENGEDIVGLGREIENDESDGVVTTRLVDRWTNCPISNSNLTIKAVIAYWRGTLSKSCSSWRLELR